MLVLDEVYVHYGRIGAVQGLSIAVNEGEFVGLVGHNGAGKSTTLLAITGVLRPSAGDIRFDGRSIVGKSPESILRQGISLVPENRQIFSRLTVGENLKIGTTIRRDRREAAEDIDRLVERFPILGHYFNSLAGRLSGGEQQQLAIARALLARPRLLLLDEPSLGLAPLLVDRLFDILEELHGEGVTMLLVEQNVARTIRTAERTYVLRSGGKVVLQGSAEELQKIPDLHESLGFTPVDE
jgi:branched-chain amino acid transport system ATP-binding protein